MARKKKTDPIASVEEETLRIGHGLWKQLSRRSPSIFDRRWWDDRILSWAMADESVKVQMFRFVDVLPMLRTHQQITQHLQEYFEDVRRHLPWAVRLGLDVSQPNTILGRAVALNARSNAMRMAERFIAGSRVEEVVQSVQRIRRDGFAFTLDLLGEAVISEQEADRYQQAYLDLMAGLATEVQSWPEDHLLDADQNGAIPRVNVSLKLTALDSHFNPIDPRGTGERVKRRLRTILRSARELGCYVHIDMEQYYYKDLTLAIFKETLSEDEFRDFADVGVVIQAYLNDADRDLQELLDWVKKRGTPIWVRLVKGAYWDYETVVSHLRGWPVPVFRQKWESDCSFERGTRFLMENYEWLRPALGSHNLRSLANGIAWARELDVPPEAFELQMLYGMAGEQAQAISELGHRVRIYAPFGELIPGMAYLVRRLLENTSNDSFLRQGFSEHVSVEKLMMSPQKIGQQATPPTDEPVIECQNEPQTDFSRQAARDAMAHALEDVAGQFGGSCPIFINVRSIETRTTLVSVNPSHRKTTIATITAAGPAEADQAVEAARNAFRRWSRVEPEERSHRLELVAAEMRIRRFELAAWIVHESGKPWAEADGDVAEAIDFCMYYAAQMRRMAKGRHCDLPGEENFYFYRPRGVAVVIAPWNFPLAILTGMTVAALVTGNTVVMKPAEQSSVVASKLMEIFSAAGLPDGVVNYLPGIGEEVGQALVTHPDVDLIAFTGSRGVGLSINAAASEPKGGRKSVTKVLAEMGGKNAIIVDDDADLDEAVMGVVHSAFGYAGQKCSACSRVIVLRGVYDTFLERLVQATASLPVGPAGDPGTVVGPVIDAEALEKVHDYIAVGKDECELAYGGDVGKLAKEGFYVAPHIFTGASPESRLAQDEIFGPVLTVLPAANLDEAFAIANNTPYALTGGIFSRSPQNLRRARSEFLVGNLYLNRGITGAFVNRQPFGGFKLSGIGSKAGGPDYLSQFVVPVNVTENTLRRGFAPTTEDEGEDE